MSSPEYLIAGAGPAGCALAIWLAERGCDVLLADLAVDAAARDSYWGEKLRPESRRLLERLGVWPTFQTLPSLPSAGTCAWWGEESPRELHGITGPEGAGWHIRRAAFDAMLAERAREAGARLVPARVQVRRAGIWLDFARKTRLSTHTADLTPVEPRWVIDAGGRTSTVAMRFGPSRHRFDRLIGHWAMVTDLSVAPELILEATPRGWWFASPLPDGDGVVCFLTDAEPDVDHRPRDLDTALAHAPAIRQWLTNAKVGPLRGVDAHTGVLDRVYGYTDSGVGWLAVGDAACSLDPLSGMGVTMALQMALHAATALSTQQLEPYQAYIRRSFEKALTARQRAYRGGRAGPFWSRRTRLMPIGGRSD